MRVKFLEGVRSKRAAANLAPWACVWLRCCGGYMAFESSSDAYTWVQQR